MSDWSEESGKSTGNSTGEPDKLDDRNPESTVSRRGRAEGDPVGISAAGTAADSPGSDASGKRDPALAGPAYENRDAIDERYKWDLSDLYASDAAFEEALEEAQDIPGKIASYIVTASFTTAGLLECLRYYYHEARVTVLKLYDYALMSYYADTTSALHQGYLQQVQTLRSKIEIADSWFVPVLITVPEETVESWYAEEPGLEEFRRRIEILSRERPYAIPPDHESLIRSADLVTQAPEAIYKSLTFANMAFPDAIDSNGVAHKVLAGTYHSLITSPDRKLRKSAFESLHRTFAQFGNTFAATLLAQHASLKFLADAHNYEDEIGAPASLVRALYQDEIPTDAYINLIEALHDNIEPIHRYTRLHGKMLGVDEQHYWDVYADATESVSMSFTFEKACDIVLQAMEPLGEQYVNDMRQAFQDR